jgi:hypothetical protein
MANQSEIGDRVLDQMADAIFKHFRRYMVKSPSGQQTREHFEHNPEEARRRAERAFRPATESKPRAA